MSNCRRREDFMNQREKEEQRQLWIARLCDLEETGMNQEEWCKAHSIPYSTFRYWMSKLRKEGERENRTTNWLKVDMAHDNKIATVQVPPTYKDGSIGIHIRLGEFTVELQNGYDPESVFELLRILKAL